MAESTASIFLRIAREKELLTDEQASEVERAQAGAAPQAVEALCVEKGFLASEQVRGIERGVRYYVIRKADKAYGKVALGKGYIDQETLDNCLKKQKRDYTSRKVLMRLSKLLIDLEAITPTQDAEVRARVVELLQDSGADDAAAAEAATAPAEAQAAEAPAEAGSSASKQG